MNKFSLLIFFGLFLAATPVIAKPLAPNKQSAPVKSQCFPSPKLFAYLVDKYNAAPTVIGKVESGTISVWQQKDGDFMMIITDDAGNSCILQDGVDLATRKWQSLDSHDDPHSDAQSDPGTEKDEDGTFGLNADQWSLITDHRTLNTASFPNLSGSPMFLG